VQEKGSGFVPNVSDARRRPRRFRAFFAYHGTARWTRRAATLSKAEPRDDCRRDERRQPRQYCVSRTERSCGNSATRIARMTTNKVSNVLTSNKSKGEIKKGGKAGETDRMTCDEVALEREQQS